MSMLVKNVLEDYLMTRDVCRIYSVELKNSVKLFSESLGREANTDDFTAMNYAKLADWLKANGKRASTTNNKLRQLKTVWYHAAELKQCEGPPRKLKRLREVQEPIQGWSAEQFGKLIRVFSKSLEAPSPVRDWFVSIQGPDRCLSFRAYEAIRAACGRFDKWSNGTPIDKVTDDQIEDHVRWLLDDGMKFATAQRERGRIFTVVNHARKNPADTSRLSSICPFAATARAALWLAWNTGVRKGDLFTARKDAVRDGVLIIRQHKTGREIRRKLWPETVEAIEALNYDGDTLLPQKSIRRVGRMIKEACRMVGVPIGQFKFARRGSASEVERNNPGAGWKHCGHTSPNIFNKHYAVQAICGDVVPEPPKPVMPGKGGGV